MDYFWTIFLQLFPLVLSLYIYISNKYSYWRLRGVAGPAPSILSFGNVFQIEGAPPDIIELELARKYGKVYGAYLGLAPTLTISDAELIKQVLVKDFSFFVNRRVSGAYHKLVNIGQFFTEGSHWKKIRTITGPAFTSGKLRGMYTIMDRCTDRLVEHLRKLEAQNRSIECREFVIGFTQDVIAETTFATKTNANDSEGGQSPLVRHGLALFDISPIQGLFFAAMPRWINDLVGVKSFFREESLNYIIKLTEEIIRQRKVAKEAGVTTKYNDLVQLLMDAYVYETELESTSYEQLATSNENDKSDVLPNGTSATNGKVKATLTEDEIIAQGFLFLIAGFETTTSVLNTLMFELAINPDIQERLFTELNTALEPLEPYSSEYYETIQTEIPYLEAVIKETLRKYPPVKRLERRLDAEEYRLGDVLLQQGQLVEVAIYPVHHNPEYYPEPETFNPERFMPENKHLLVPYTYLPFGAGPRNCIGLRFAYQEIRIYLAKIIRQFRFSRSADTPSKLTFSTFRPTLSPKQFPIKLEVR